MNTHLLNNNNQNKNLKYIIILSSLLNMSNLIINSFIIYDLMSLNNNIASKMNITL
jgi:hypothetical protein